MDPIIQLIFKWLKTKACTASCWIITICSYKVDITFILTCRFNETDALLNKDRDWPLRSDHVDQRHTKVVAFNGFWDGMSGFGSWFLKREKKTEYRQDWWEESEQQTVFMTSYYISLINTDTHFQNDIRAIVLKMNWFRWKRLWPYLKVSLC